jgi:hypothetical protein
MPNGRCRMHGGATPRGARHGAFTHGEYTIEAIGERRKAAALHEKATALLVDAIRAQTDVALKLRRGTLRPGDAKARQELTRVQITAALATREMATELRDA